MRPGKHVGTVIKHTYGHSAQKGTPHFHVEFQVDSDTGSEMIAGDIWLTDAAMGMARKSLKAMGYDPDTQDLDALVDNPALLMGHKVTLEIVEEEGRDGEWRLKVAFINAVAGPVAPDELKRLSKSLRDVKGSTKKETLASKPVTEKAETEIAKHFASNAEAKVGGDDIPF